MPEPHAGIPQLSEAVGWRIRFWWVGTCEWVEGEVLSYRATDSRHLVLFADGESEWISVSGETIWWLANTRERGNRLAPLGYGLDGAAIPKGRDAIEWRVDIYDRSLNQFLRGEIAEFDSVTGKHKIEYTNDHKPTWLSLTASKIIWRFPPGLPAPASEPPTPREDAEPKPGASQQAPAVPAKRGRSTNGGRKSSQISGGVEATAPEGTTVLPKQKSRKLSTPSSPKVKGGKGRISSGDAVFVRADSTVASDKAQQRAPEKKTSPHATPSHSQQGLHRSSSDVGGALPVRTAPATEHVAKKQRLMSIKQSHQAAALHIATADRAMGGKGSVPPNSAVPVQQQAAPVAGPKPVSQPAAHKSSHHPAIIHRHSLRTPLASNMLRTSPFTQVSMTSHSSLLKSASCFSDVRSLLDATQKRATFIKDVLRFLDTLETVPPAPPNLQPAPTHVPSPASTPALPTDPRPPALPTDPRRQPGSKPPAHPSATVDVARHTTPASAAPRPPTTDAAPSRAGAPVCEAATAAAAAPASAAPRTAQQGAGPPRFPKVEAAKPPPPSSSKQSPAAPKPSGAKPPVAKPLVAPSAAPPFTPRFVPLSDVVNAAHAHAALASGASIAAMATSPVAAKAAAGMVVASVPAAPAQAKPAAVNAAGTATPAHPRPPVPAPQPTPASGPPKPPAAGAQAAQHVQSVLGASLPQLSVMQQAYPLAKHARPPAPQPPPEGPPAPPDQTSSSGKDAGGKDTSTGGGGKMIISTESCLCSDILCKEDRVRSASAEVEPVSDKSNFRDGHLPLCSGADADLENGNANLQHHNVNVAATAQPVKLARDSNVMLENSCQDPSDVDALNRSSSSNMKFTARLRWTGMPFGRGPALGLKGGSPATAAGSAGGRACG